MKTQPDYVVGFAFSPDRQSVLLINKTKPAWMKGLLNGIGGKIENGETGAEAMRREAHEEANLDLEWKPVILLMAANARHGMPDATIYVFMSVCNIMQAESLTEEQLEIHPVNALPPNVVSNLPWLIPLCNYANIAGFPVIRERAA